VALIMQRMITMRTFGGPCKPHWSVSDNAEVQGTSQQYWALIRPRATLKDGVLKLTLPKLATQVEVSVA
jgi:hypothetical protein